MSHNGRRTRRYSTNSVRSKSSRSSRSSSPTLLRDTLRGRIVSDKINAASRQDSFSSDEVGWTEQRQRALSIGVIRPLYLQDIFADPRSSRSGGGQKGGCESTDSVVGNTRKQEAAFSSSEHGLATELDEAVWSGRKQSKLLAIRTTPSVLQQEDSQDTTPPTGEVDVDDPPTFQEIFPKPLPNNKPLTYSSLPPTPIASSPPLVTTTFPVTPTKPSTSYQQPFSIWDYLQEELLATDFDSHQEMKWERVSNFLNIPYAIEKVTQNTLFPFVEADMAVRSSVLGSSCASTPFCIPSPSSQYDQPWHYGVCCAISSLGNGRLLSPQLRRPTFCVYYSWWRQQ